MTEVAVTFARDSGLVRTVRLVAAAVARRAARDEEFVEEVRLAVGEACGLLVGASLSDPGADAGDSVTVRMRLDGTFAVSVTAAESIVVAASRGEAALDPWTLLRGLVGDVEVRHRDGVVVVCMRWPAV
jgi:hypothetical protein